MQHAETKREQMTNATSKVGWRYECARQVRFKCLSSVFRQSCEVLLAWSLECGPCAVTKPLAVLLLGQLLLQRCLDTCCVRGRALAVQLAGSHGMPGRSPTGGRSSGVQSSSYPTSPSKSPCGGGSKTAGSNW